MGSISQRIAEARHRADLTQEELAESVGVSLQTVRNWETNSRHHKPPARDRLEPIAAALGVTQAYLLGEDDTLPPAVPRIPKSRGASDDLLLQVIASNQKVVEQNQAIIAQLLQQNAAVLEQNKTIIQQNDRLERRLASIEGKLLATDDPGSSVVRAVR